MCTGTCKCASTCSTYTTCSCQRHMSPDKPGYLCVLHRSKGGMPLHELQTECPGDGTPSLSDFIFNRARTVIRRHCLVCMGAWCFAVLE